MVSGDPAEDKKTEDAIIRELESGNQWAWCMVKVTASVTVDQHVFTGTDYLGCSSYSNEQDFTDSVYYQDMRGRALEDLKANLGDQMKLGALARTVADKLTS